jgi:hypothetical protein
LLPEICPSRVDTLERRLLATTSLAWPHQYKDRNTPDGEGSTVASVIMIYDARVIGNTNRSAPIRLNMFV